MNGWRWRWRALLGTALLTGVGCAGPGPAVATDPSHAPPDFSVDLAILADESIARRQGAEFHNSHYVVLPDGSLHVATGLDIDRGSRPPLIRQLKRDQFNAFYRFVRDLGLIDDANITVEGNLQTLETIPGQVTYLATITVDDHHLTFGRTMAPDDANAPTMVRLARVLARLAWVSDEPGEATMRIPRRYDFGPDPYARYR